MWFAGRGEVCGGRKKIEKSKGEQRSNAMRMRESMCLLDAAAWATSHSILRIVASVVSMYIPAHNMTHRFGGLSPRLLLLIPVLSFPPSPFTGPPRTVFARMMGTSCRCLRSARTTS